ncbi:MAG: DUF4238 domain-containing protein [Bacteroidetes bacterium]|nr:DUF4238 domain-containing protein [Bacteroidota bacterium]
MGTANKNHHFVPVVYLKRWGHKTDKVTQVYCLSNKDRLVRKNQPQNLNYKKNLYTLPDTFVPEIRKIAETAIYKTWEDRWGQVLPISFDLGVAPTGLDLRSIKAFIFHQSIRTLKYIRESEKVLQKLNDEIINRAPHSVFHTSAPLFLFTTFSTSYTINFLKAPLNCRFITSDNPATHWLIDGENYHNIPTVVGRTDLYKNTNYKIICPITPKWLGVLTPNLGIAKSEFQLSTGSTIEIPEHQVEFYNKLIEMTSDKLIFALNIMDLK